MSLNLLKLLGRATFLSERRRLELYPPFWFMRVKVLELAPDWQRIRLKLPLNMLSRNMGNGMFGGYQASLSDPIAALACAKQFPGHEVWTRHHAVDFCKVGNSDLELRFEFAPAVHAQISAELAQQGRSTPTFHFGFFRQDGSQCTWISSTVAIRPRGYKQRSMDS